jgi:hypothetical protein
MQLIQIDGNRLAKQYSLHVDFEIRNGDSTAPATSVNHEQTQPPKTNPP